MDQAQPSTTNPALRKIVIDLSIMTVIGLVLAFVGPFGSFQEPLAFRLVSWLTFAYVGYAIYSPMSFFVDRAAMALDLPKGPLWLVAVAVATVPMTAAVWIMSHLPGTIPTPSLDQAMTRYFYVFVIGGGVTGLFYALERRGQEGTGEQSKAPAEIAQPSTPILPQGSPSNPLIDQMPAELGSDVIALEMEDHYVRVHTSLGSELVLMRLRDAMLHVADIEGRQTHRSWWVARGAVEDVRREGRNVKLVLTRGIEAPVSRAQVSELKEAGWL